MSGLTQTRAASFGAAADAYERARPSYPEAAIDWLLPRSARRILDLGAGTGKLTRQIRARGVDVVAVEPSEGMRTRFSRGLPDVPVFAGSAEAIPLEDASVDAVVVGQAWHWFDPARAVPEVARVLNPAAGSA
jgi:SAM-dependent methyltransferase